MSVGFTRVKGQQLLRLRERLPVANSTLLIALAAFLVGCFPIFAGPSYPSALLFGLFVPSITAVSATLLVADVDVNTVEAQFGRALKRAGAHAAALTLPLGLHALRVGWCDPVHDLVLLGLGPLMGLVMAATWATGNHLLLRRFLPFERHRKLFVVAALLGPIGSVFLGLVAFYGSPIVYAFDPFVGFFAGSPYDTGFDPTTRLLTYRAGSLGTLVAFIAVLRHLEFSPTHRPQLKKALDRPVLFLGTFGLVLSVAITIMGVSLGHRSTTESIREALGQTLQVGRCEVVYGPQQRRVEVERVATDCDAWLKRLERRLGAARLEHVTAYLFDGPAEKERLMGAAHTQIAKPWRHEIYLNGASYPDDVLGHELAHVVSGQVAQGPFAVAGSLFGLLPNPGLIEGLAVALAPDEDGDLTPTEWARTLADLKQLPPIEPLFSLSFFGQSSTMAYTVAGAFVEFIGSTYGKASLRAWYRGQSLDAITGTSFKQLEQRFKAHLETVVLPSGALEAARARFARKGLFSRRCPHAVDRTVDAANQRLRQGDAPHACTLYEHAVSLDSTEVAARFGLGDCARRSSQLTRAEDAYRKLANDPNLPTLIRERADELLADLYFENQELAKAKAIYTRLAESTFEADRRRSLELKAHADSPAAVTALRSLLIGEHGEKAWDLAVRDLLLWSEAAPSSGIADYLLGRNFWLQGREAAAVQHLDRALAKSIEPPDIKAEALRLRAVIACALHDKTTAIALADKVAHESQLLTPRRLGLLRLVERCAGRPLDDDWPETRDPTQVVTVSAATSTKTPHDGSHAATNGKLVWNSESFTCPSGMVKIPGDVFWMGSIRGRNSDDETPRFQTEVAGFCLDETEVTVAAYRECVERGDCRPVTADNKTCNFEHDDRRLHPINCVDYEQAQTFCAKRQARLPTEIEWEYAARGGTRELKYPWGDASPDGHACWKTYMSCPVKTYAAGAFGLFDMSGNVWEWTSSDYAPYPFVPPDGENQQKVYRGGSWSRRFEKWMHLGLRNRWKPHDSGSHLGFRCAKSASELGCPGSVGADGQCLRTVLNADCPFGEKWNGYRCAPPNAPLCEDGDHADRDHGCIRDIPIVIQEQPADTQSVHRSRSPEFDADCRTNQPSRPRAYRYFGGDHLARNLVEKQSGCKNRDVGAGWNSACCP